MLVQQCINAEFLKLEEVLMRIDDEKYNGAYSAPRIELSNTSIGTYVREIIELFFCLLHGYDNGCVNYYQRYRDIKAGQNNIYAISLLREIADEIKRDDRPLLIESKFHARGQIQIYESSYGRELMYMLENTTQILNMITCCLHPDKYYYATADPMRNVSKRLSLPNHFCN